MKLLRETIQQIILEDVCAGASAKIQQGLDEIEKRDLNVEVSILIDGYDIKLLDESGSVVGEFEVSSSRLCPAYITMYTDVDSYLQGTGIGAVMYDVAIEVAALLARLNKPSLAFIIEGMCEWRCCECFCNKTQIRMQQSKFHRKLLNYVDRLGLSH